MKKVVERLNRVLAIVLAIAMVATCIPQTALTVYASETETEESTTESEKTDDAEKTDETVKPEDSEKTDETAKPEDSEKTDETAKPENPEKTDETIKPENPEKTDETSSASESSKQEESSSASEPANTETPVDTSANPLAETDEAEEETGEEILRGSKWTNKVTLTGGSYTNVATINYVESTPSKNDVNFSGVTDVVDATNGLEPSDTDNSVYIKVTPIGNVNIKEVHIGGVKQEQVKDSSNKDAGYYEITAAQAASTNVTVEIKYNYKYTVTLNKTITGTAVFKVAAKELANLSGLTTKAMWDSAVTDGDLGNTLTSPITVELDKKDTTYIVIKTVESDTSRIVVSDATNPKTANCNDADTKTKYYAIPLNGNLTLNAVETVISIPTQGQQVGYSVTTSGLGFDADGNFKFKVTAAKSGQTYTHNITGVTVKKLDSNGSTTGNDLKTGTLAADDATYTIPATNMTAGGTYKIEVQATQKQADPSYTVTLDKTECTTANVVKIATKKITDFTALDTAQKWETLVTDNSGAWADALTSPVTVPAADAANTYVVIKTVESKTNASTNRVILSGATIDPNKVKTFTTNGTTTTYRAILLNGDLDLTAVETVINTAVEEGAKYTINVSKDGLGFTGEGFKFEVNPVENYRVDSVTVTKTGGTTPVGGVTNVGNVWTIPAAEMANGGTYAVTATTSEAVGVTVKVALDRATDLKAGAILYKEDDSKDATTVNYSNASDLNSLAKDATKDIKVGEGKSLYINVTNSNANAKRVIVTTKAKGATNATTVNGIYLNAESSCYWEIVPDEGMTVEISVINKPAGNKLSLARTGAGSGSYTGKYLDVSGGTTGVTFNSIKNPITSGVTTLDTGKKYYIALSAPAGMKITNVTCAPANDGFKAVTGLTGVPVGSVVYEIASVTRATTLTMTFANMYTVTVPATVDAAVGASNYKITVTKGETAGSSNDVTTENRVQSGLDVGDKVKITFDRTAKTDVDAEITYKNNGTAATMGNGTTTGGKTTYTAEFTVADKDIEITDFAVKEKCKLAISGTGVTGKIIELTGTAADDAITLSSITTNIDANTKVEKDKGYYVVLDAGSSNVVKTVTAAGCNVTKVGLGGKAIYELSEITGSSGVTLTVTTGTKVNVPVTVNTGVAKVYYTTETDANSVNESGFVEVALSGTSGSFDVASDATVNVYVEYESHYECDKVTINGTVSTADNTSKLYSVAVSGELDEQTRGVKVEAKEKLVTVDVDAVTGGAVIFTGTGIRSYGDTTGEENKNNLTNGVTVPATGTKIKVFEGTTVAFTIAPNAGYKRGTVTFAGVKNPRVYRGIVDGKFSYEFVAEYAASASEIDVTAMVAKMVSGNVTFIVDGDNETELTKVKYFKGTTDTAGTDSDNFAEDNNIYKTTVTNIGDVQKFGFNLVFGDNSRYEVDSILWTTGALGDNSVWENVPKGSSETGSTDPDYVFASGIPEDGITVKITLKEDLTKINNYTVTYTGGAENYVRVYKESAADSTTGNEVVEPGTPVIISEGSAAYIRVVPVAGYKATVTIDGTAQAAITAGQNYTLNFTSEKKAVPVSIAVAADTSTATANKFVKITNITEDIAFALKNNGDVKKDWTKRGEKTYRVYEIEKSKTELEFTVTVPKTHKYVDSYKPATPVIQIGDCAESTDKKSWVYTYKIVMAQITDSDNSQAKPKEIALGSVERKEVTITVKDSAGIESIYANGYEKTLTGSAGSQTLTVFAGSDVRVKVKDGYDLYTDWQQDSVTNRVTKKKVALSDSVGKIGPVANNEDEPVAEDKIGMIVDNFAITTVAKKVYTVEVKVGSDDAVTGNAVYAEIGNTVEIQVKESNTAVNLTKAIKASGSDFTTTFTADKNDKKIVGNIVEGDKNKKIELTLHGDVQYTEGSETYTKEESLANVTITVLDSAKTVDVYNGKSKVKNGSKLTVDPLKTLSYDLDIKPAGTKGDYFKAIIVGDDGAIKSATATPTITGDRLVITTGAAEITAASKTYVAIVKQADSDGKAALWKAPLVVKSPALKATKVESPYAGYDRINLALTADKKLLDNIQAGKWAYYKVEVTAGTGVGTVPASAPNTTYYIPFEDDGTARYNAQVNSTSPGWQGASMPKAWPYSFAVTIVIADTNSDTTKKYEVVTTEPGNKIAESNPAKEVVTKTFSTKAPSYETKLSVKAKKTTILNGESNVLAGTVSYSRVASYVGNCGIQIYDKDGVDITTTSTDTDKIKGEVKENGDVYISVGTGVKSGAYTAVVSADSINTTVDSSKVYTMYRATASLKITVKASQQTIDAGTYPSKIVRNSKKDVTVKLKPYAVDALGDKSVSQKFVYELVDGPKNSNPTALSTRTDLTKAEQNVLDKVKVDNSGNVKIQKDFNVSALAANNMVYVKIKASDYAGNTSYDVAAIEVTDRNMEIGKIYLATAADRTGTVVDANNIKVGATPFVVVEDVNGEIITDYVTLTPAYKAGTNCVQNVENGGKKFNAAKPGKVTIKAKTDDGGNKTAQLTVTVGYKAFTDMKYTLTSTETDGLVKGNGDKFTYVATNDAKLTFTVYNDVDNNDTINGNGSEAAGEWDYNYKVKVTGATCSGNKTNGVYTIVPTKKTFTIELTDQVAKPKPTPTKVEVTNLAFVDTAAPKLTTTDALYTDLYGKEGTAETQTVTYRVASTQYDAVYVEKVSGVDAFDSSECKEHTITDGTFTLDRTAVLTTAGTAKYSFTFGTMAGATASKKFVAQTKPVTVSVKVNKLGTFKPTLKYTMVPDDSTIIGLTGTPAYMLKNVTFSDLQNDNLGIGSNEFLELFELDNGKIKLKSGVTSDDARLTDSKNLKGYVTYEYYIGASRTVKKIARIEIKYDTKARPAYTAVMTGGSSILGAQNAEMTVYIRKGNGPVALKAGGIEVVKKDKTTKASNWILQTGSGTSDLESGKAVFKTNAVESETELYFRIIPKDSLTTEIAQGQIVSTKVKVVKVADKFKQVNSSKTVDLNKAAHSWKNSKGEFVYTLPASKVYTLANGATVATIQEEQAAASAARVAKVPGFTVKLDNGNVVITAEKEKVEELIEANTKQQTVDAKVTFGVGGDPATLNFTIKMPTKIADEASVKADITAYLKKFVATNDNSKAADEATIKAALNGGASPVIDPITGITATTVTATYTTSATPKTYNVVVTIKGPGETDTEKPMDGVSILAPKKLASITAAENAVKVYIANISGEATGSSGVTLGRDLNNWYKLRNYLAGALEGSSYGIIITSYTFTPPTDGTSTSTAAGANGTLNFEWKVFDKSSVGTIQKVGASGAGIALNSKAYTAPTTPSAPAQP